MPFLFCLCVCIHVCRIITYLGLIVFIFRITVSAIYLALRLLFTLCMFELHYSVDLNKLNDDDDDDEVVIHTVKHDTLDHTKICRFFVVRPKTYKAVIQVTLIE